MGLNHGGYILTVGTIEPRKNILHVLEAFAQIPAAIRERFPLVVAGARGWRASDIVSRLRRLADRGQIRFLGHVGGATLPCLYAGAASFVFPSLYEGFGLPPLEAMASGVPVIASNRASVPEVMGDAGQSLEPDSPEDTAAKITALLDDPSERAAMAQRGIERAAGIHLGSVRGGHAQGVRARSSDVVEARNEPAGPAGITRGEGTQSQARAHGIGASTRPIARSNPVSSLT